MDREVPPKPMILFNLPLYEDDKKMYWNWMDYDHVMWKAYSLEYYVCVCDIQKILKSISLSE